MKKEVREKIGAFSLVLLIVYGCIVLYFVLFSDRLGRTEGYSTYRYNLMPFEEIRQFIVYREYVSTEAFVLNLIGNLFVFFPIGVLVPLWRTKKTGGFLILRYTFLCTLCIETLQLITKVGVFDVDDLMMNTLGGMIGWVCYCAALKFFRYVGRRKGKTEKKKEKE
ncbi:MAG: VanZ family protein [Eubacteriales bacterium]|nr:VanZ family protein [Eubacteriales bacterium]